MDVFHNAISFSEMAPETIEEYLSQVERTTRGFLYHVNLHTEDFVNRGYVRTPSTQFKVGPGFRKLYRIYDLYLGPYGDYSEFLYQRR